MATIQSATGPLETADLGLTLMHEHVLVMWPPMLQQYPEVYDREALMGRAIERLRSAREAGVRSMVDLTPVDLGRDATFIREAARASDMQIIVATGFYYTRPFYFLGRDDADMTALMVRDITEGISTTGVRANVIKCASEPEVDPVNERVLRASARAHRQTGVPICTHTFPANRTGLEQQRVFKDEGADLSRIVIGHSDDSDDIGYLEQIIQNGSYCGMDRIGIPAPRTNEQRADMVTALVERGYADRITLSHDSSVFLDMVDPDRLAGATDWRYEFIPTGFSDMLRERGVSDDAIEQMTVRNPRTIFEQNQPY